MSQSQWFKSSYSNAEGNCVELQKKSLQVGPVMVRDNKNIEGPSLVISHQAWASFVSSELIQA